MQALEETQRRFLYQNLENQKDQKENYLDLITVLKYFPQVMEILGQHLSQRNHVKQRVVKSGLRVAANKRSALERRDGDCKL